jgi:tetratricopeptide (TPR) repeat protein
MTCIARRPDHPRFAHPADQFSLGRLHWVRGRHKLALERFEAAAAAAQGELADTIVAHLGRAYKRLGHFDQAVALWQTRSAYCRPGRMEPLVELAKHAEHRLRDYAAALAYTRRALAILDLAAQVAIHSAAADALAADRAALEHRRARLQRRLKKHSIRITS